MNYCTALSLLFKASLTGGFIFLFFRRFTALASGKLLKSRLIFPYKCQLRQIQMANTLNCIRSGGNTDSRGALIVLEGLDRSGKTSQSSRLLTYLEGRGHSVELWRFPDRSTSVGQMISSYLSNKSQLDDHTIHLLFSANRWEKRFVMSSYCSFSCSLISGILSISWDVLFVLIIVPCLLYVFFFSKSVCENEILAFDGKTFNTSPKLLFPIAMSLISTCISSSVLDFYSSVLSILVRYVNTFK